MYHNRQEVGPVKEFVKEKEFLALCALVILFFYRPLFFETFFFRDLYLSLYPQKLHFAEIVKSGQLPLWDPYLHGGQPFLADIHNTAIYPSGLLYLLLPPVQAFNTDIVLHLLFCAAGAYLFARAVGLAPVSSLIAGAVYGFCGYTLSFVNLFDRFLAVPYLPFLLLLWHQFLSTQKKKWFAIAVLAAFCQLLTGALEMVTITFVTLLGWTLLYPYTFSLARRIVFYIMLVLFAGGLSSVQTFPAAEMLSQSTRGAGFSYPSFAAWSVHPKRLPETFLPGFLGYTNRVTGRAYWGGSLEGMRFPYVLSIYFGLTTLTLAMVGGISNKADEGPPIHVRRFLLIVGALALIFSLGQSLPFFHALYRQIPLIHGIRYPVKFLAAAVLPIALLSGWASSRYFGDRSDWKPSLKILGVFWAIAFVFTAFTLCFRLSDRFANGFTLSYFGVTGKTVCSGISISLVHAAGIWLLFTLLCQARRLQRKGWHHFALAGFILIDLMWAGQSVNQYAPRQFFTDEPNLARVVQSELGDGRFLRMPNPRGIVFQMPSDDVLYLARWNLETLENYTAAFYHIPVIFHENFDGLARREINRLADLVHKLPWERKLPVLHTTNVRLVLSAEDVSIPGMQKLAVVRNKSNRVFFLYSLIDSAPRVTFVRDSILAATEQEMLETMTRPDFDPRKSVILSSPPVTTSGPCEPAQIRKLDSSNHAAAFQVQSDCNGFIVFSEPDYPGWRVEIDGKEEQVLRANFAFSAVPIKAGTHSMRRHYLPDSVRWGAAVSLVFGALLVVILRLKWFGESL